MRTKLQIVTVASSSRAEHEEHARQDLLDALLRLFAARRYAGTSRGDPTNPLFKDFNETILGKRARPTECGVRSLRAFWPTHRANRLFSAGSTRARFSTAHNLPLGWEPECGLHSHRNKLFSAYVMRRRVT